MEVLHFPSLDEAEEHLKRDGYSFQGAPSRRRKEAVVTARYAEALPQGSGAVVLITELWRGPAAPAG